MAGRAAWVVREVLAAEPAACGDREDGDGHSNDFYKQYADEDEGAEDEAAVPLDVAVRVDEVAAEPVRIEQTTSTAR